MSSRMLDPPENILCRTGGQDMLHVSEMRQHRLSRGGRVPRLDLPGNDLMMVKNVLFVFVLPDNVIKPEKRGLLRILVQNA